MFAYPLPSIPTHFQPILIENQSSPIGIDPTTLKTNFPSVDRGGQPKSDLLSPINEQHPYANEARRNTSDARNTSDGILLCRRNTSVRTRVQSNKVHVIS